MSRVVRALLLSFALAVPAVGEAQDLVTRADTLLRRGDLRRAEDLYYAAVRRQPRDPVARLALGRYLAARGALKVGAVLMEEARFFGGDVRIIARQLAPVYARLGDYRALASLPGSQLAVGERVRATWLQSNPASVEGPDSATVTLMPADSAIGAVSLILGDDTLRAVVDAGVQGIVLDTAWTGRAGVKVFKGAAEADRRNFAGVALSARLGPLSLLNQPVRFAPLGAGEARIGLDVLARLAPTFDPDARRLTLRRTGRIAPTLAGERVPVVALPAEPLVVRGGAWAMDSTEGRYVLRGRWTYDARRGEIVLGA